MSMWNQVINNEQILTNDYSFDFKILGLFPFLKLYYLIEEGKTQLCKVLSYCSIVFSISLKIKKGSFKYIKINELMVSI